MWPPNIGITELVMLALLILVSPIFVTRGSRWLLGILPCFALAVVLTPSDPGSMLLAGGVLSALYVSSVLLSRLLVGGRHDEP